MRTAIIAACSGTASLIAGVIAPMVIPPTLPDWVRWVLLATAAALYLIAIVAWFIGRRPDETGNVSQSGHGNSQFTGPVQAPVHIGNIYNADFPSGPFGTPWKPKSKPRQPIRDIPVSEAVVFLCRGEWGASSEWSLEESDQEILETVLRELEQAARDGWVQIWGRDAPRAIDINDWHTTQEPIPAEHWRKHWIDAGSLNGIAKSAQRMPYREDRDRYYDLMTCRWQIERMHR